MDPELCHHPDWDQIAQDQADGYQRGLESLNALGASFDASTLLESFKSAGRLTDDFAEILKRSPHLAKLARPPKFASVEEADAWLEQHAS